MKGWSDKGVQSDLAIIGSKGVSFFGSVGGNVVAQVTGMGDKPALSDLIGPVKVMLQAYDEGRIDKLYIVSNKFNNTMSQTPTITQLLPLPPAEGEEEMKAKTGLPVRTRSESAAGYPCVVMSNRRFIRVWWKTSSCTYGGYESGNR